jgi:hypothetical protein
VASKWTRDFITGVFGVRVPDAEWEAHDEARRPKPRPVKRRIRYENARPLPQHVTEGLLVAMAMIDYRRRWTRSVLPPVDAGWWRAIEDQARWDRS